MTGNEGEGVWKKWHDVTDAGRFYTTIVAVRRQLV